MLDSLPCKIAFVISGKSPMTFPGGLGAYSYNVAKILNQLSFKVFIIGFNAKEEVVDLEFATLLHFRNPYAGLRELGVLPAIKLFVKQMERVITESKPSEIVVYSAGIWGLAGIALAQSQMITNIKVQTLVGYFTTFKHEFKGHILGAPVKDYGLFFNLLIRALYVLVRIFYSPIERRMLKRTDIIVVHYNSVRDILLSEFSCLPPQKVVKIPYYIDLYDRTSDVKFVKKSDTTQPTVTVICRQDPRKGINTFLKAVRILRDRDIKFNCIIAGDSRCYFYQNNKLVRKLGLSDFVRFPGFVPSTESLLVATDIYVLPSVEEGSGAISLLEAMKIGVAIVTTMCDGIPEDFVNGETGMLVTPGDPNQMADAIELLLVNIELRHKLALNAKIDYPKKFNFEKMKIGIGNLIE